MRGIQPQDELTDLPPDDRADDDQDAVEHREDEIADYLRDHIER